MVKPYKIYPYDKWKVIDLTLNPKYVDDEDNTFDENEIEGKNVTLSYWINFPEIVVGEYPTKYSENTGLYSWSYLYICPELTISYNRNTHEFDYDFFIYSDDPATEEVIELRTLEWEKDFGDKVYTELYQEVTDCLCEHEEEIIEKVIAFMEKNYPEQYEKYVEFMKEQKNEEKDM